MDKWRGSSNWRTPKDSATPPSPPVAARARDSRPYQGRLAASSWRTKDQDNNGTSQTAEPRREQGEKRNSWTPGSRPSDRERAPGRAKADESTTRAIAEGRRIYMGNLRYQAKPDDIEGLLTENELSNFESIHISIDHFTGRNPSYCFVEFPDRESADRAMSTLEGKLLLGREVKCRPCIPKGGPSGGRQSESMNRWGNWSGEKNDSNGNEGEPGTGRSQEEDGPPPSRYTKDFTGQRLYVGGLPRMLDQATNFSEISDLFKDFQIEAVSKRITAHESTRAKPGNHDFCFVDFATPDQAQAALDAMNGAGFRGGSLKVSLASGRSNKWQERDNLR
ncbi:hypothetical protein M426DRAFT_64808 [Hypoxylon sp. CI-4A]|nr:hypothetical protein M426DRAFT_64808 [Hypoxylon sp. CI-4A]